MSYCAYYQAFVDRSKMWFFVATLRAEEHLAFDRTFDKKEERVEFLVPVGCEQRFVALMNDYINRGVVQSFSKLPNRFSEEAQCCSSENR